MNRNRIPLATAGLLVAWMVPETAFPLVVEGATGNGGPPADGSP